MITEERLESIILQIEGFRDCPCKAFALLLDLFASTSQPTSLARILPRMKSDIPEVFAELEKRSGADPRIQLLFDLAFADQII